MALLPKGSTFIRPVRAIVLLAFIWQVVSWVFPGWPGPGRIVGVFLGNFLDPEFLGAFQASASRMIIGYLLVMALGVTGGIVLGRFPLMDQVIGSLAVATYAIPGAAWVPLTILWFGMTEQAVIFTILLGAVGIVIVKTDTGIREAPPAIVRATRTLGARGVRYFWFVEVPAAIPKIVDGLRLAWAFGWRALMAGELLISVNGLGQRLNEVARTRQLDQLLAIMLLIALIGIMVDGLIFKRIEHAVRVRWGLV